MCLYVRNRVFFSVFSQKITVSDNFHVCFLISGVFWAQKQRYLTKIQIWMAVCLFVCPDVLLETVRKKFPVSRFRWPRIGSNFHLISFFFLNFRIHFPRFKFTVSVRRNRSFRRLHRPNFHLLHRPTQPGATHKNCAAEIAIRVHTEDDEDEFSGIRGAGLFVECCGAGASQARQPQTYFKTINRERVVFNINSKKENWKLKQ